MCKIGDLIVVYNPKVRHKPIGKHTFIVLDDTNGIVTGMYEYDFISLLLTSYSDNDIDRKEKLHSKTSNFPIAKDDKVYDKDTTDSTSRNSYVVANDFFYFHKSKISYRKIGSVTPDIYNLITEFINDLNKEGIPIRQITDKARKIEEQESDTE